MNRRNFLKGFIAASTVAALAPVSLVEVPIAESIKWVDFEQIATITLKAYRPILADAILSSPYSRFKTSMFNYPEGTAIVEPIVRESIWTKIIQSRKADGTLR